MVYALMEGLAGVEDQFKLFEHVRLSPRWIAAGRDEAEVRCMYGASGASIQYSYSHHRVKKEIELEVHGGGRVDLHVLLPRDTEAVEVRVNGKKVKYANAMVENSPYVDASFFLRKRAVVEMKYKER